MAKSFLLDTVRHISRHCNLLKALTAGCVLGGLTLQPICIAPNRHGKGIRNPEKLVGLKDIT
jgi:hypothetical protein